MADSPFVWGAGGAQMTPEQIATQRKVAQAMMAAAGDYSPIKSAWQGAARAAQGLVGGFEAGQADRADTANAEANKQMIAALLGGGVASPAVSPAASVSSAPSVGSAPTAAPAPDTAGKIYRNDEPSPLDPPSGVDRQNMVATILGEAGNEPQLGKNAVASVIRSRAVDGGYGGDTPTGVVQAPNQFEPWNTQAGRDRMQRAAANPQQAAAAEAAIASAYGEGGKAPEDPTEGMTHFYSPGGQAALGRSAPAWAGGESVKIGGHVFNSPDDAAPGAKPVQVASASAFAPQDAVSAVNAAAQPPTAPVAKVAGAMNGVNPAIIAAVTSPYASAQTKQIAGIMLQAQLSKEKKDSHSQTADADGNIWDVNDTTGQRTVALKSEKDSKKPASVQEYEYYKQTLPQDQKPMDYGTWSTAKARAGATTVNNNVGGGSDKQIFDTFAENTKEARAAATGLTALRTARQSLQGPGGVITGFGADESLGFRKLGAALGLANPDAIQNTETFRAAIAPQVAATLKATVGTANISNSDREFAEKAAGGSIKLDAGSISRLLDIMERAGTARLQLHQEQLDSVYPDPVANKRERALFGVKMPEAPATAPASSGADAGAIAEARRRGLIQ